MTLLCITNSMDDVRSCTIRDQHTVRCDGNVYRWNERKHRWDTIGACTGCLPRLAKVGLLCIVCWEKVEHAFAEWTPARAAMIASVSRTAQPDTAGRTSGPEGYVPIPGTRLAVEEIRSYLRSFPGRTDMWVSTENGAKDAVRFARVVPAALRTYELEEKAHKIRRTRCPECRQLTLVWTPPTHESARVRVTCKACGAEVPQESFEKLAAIEDPTRSMTPVLIEGGQAVNRRGFFAEDFDPTTRPEHEGLDPLTALTKTELGALAAERLGKDPDEVRLLLKLTKPDLITAINAALRGEDTPA